MSRNISSRNLIQKFLNSHFYLTICMNFFTFISHVVSLQFKQPLFFPRFYKVHLIVITRYVSYTPILVARQLGGIQHVSRTTKLSWFSMLFKDHSVLKVIMENIKQDWKLVVLIKKKKRIRWFEGSNHYWKVPEVKKSIIHNCPYESRIWIWDFASHWTR